MLFVIFEITWRLLQLQCPTTERQCDTLHLLALQRLFCQWMRALSSHQHGDCFSYDSLVFLAILSNQTAPKRFSQRFPKAVLEIFCPDLTSKKLFKVSASALASVSWGYVWASASYLWLCKFARGLFEAQLLMIWPWSSFRPWEMSPRLQFC